MKKIGFATFATPSDFVQVSSDIQCIALNGIQYYPKLGQMIDDPLYGHKYAIMNFWTLLLSFLLVLVLYER